MKRILIICFLLSFSVNSKASSSECSGLDNLVSPQIKMNIASFDIKYDFTKSEEEIKNLATDKGGENSIVRGLTTGMFNDDMNIEYSIRQVSNGYCIMPKNVVIELEWTPVTIYIENKYNEDSCQHRAIMEHENKHALIYQRTMAQYGEIIENDFRKALDSGYYPVFVPQGNESNIKSFIEEPLYNLMRQEGDNFDITLKQRNQQLDAPISIEYTEHECSKW